MTADEFQNQTEPLIDAAKRAVARAVKELSGALHSRDPQVRLVAWQGLAKLGKKAIDESGDTSVARESLDPPDRHVYPTTVLRRQVAAALARLQSGAGIGYLIAGIRDENDPQRLMYMEAITECGPNARYAVWVLGEVLHRGSLPERIQAAKSLAALGPYARPALPVLIEAARDDHPDDDQYELRREAIIALGKLGAAAHPAVPDLCWALDVFHLGHHAAKALAAIGSSEGISALADAIRCEKPVSGGDALLANGSEEAIAALCRVAPAYYHFGRDMEARVAATEALAFLRHVASPSMFETTVARLREQLSPIQIRDLDELVATIESIRVFGQPDEKDS